MRRARGGEVGALQGKDEAGKDPSQAAECHPSGWSAVSRGDGAQMALRSAVPLALLSEPRAGTAPQVISSLQPWT